MTVAIQAFFFLCSSKLMYIIHMYIIDFPKQIKHKTHCELSGHSKVSQFSMSFCVQENIASFYVSVNLPHEMKIFKALQCGFEDGSNLIFSELLVTTFKIITIAHGIFTMTAVPYPNTFAEVFRIPFCCAIWWCPTQTPHRSIPWQSISLCF